MKIYVLNGPNLNMLGIREPEHYGKATYGELCEMVKKHAQMRGVEVHISKVEEREDFRQVSYIRLACQRTITGHGLDGYIEAIDHLIDGVE